MIHLGGDEVDVGCWGKDPEIKAYMDGKGIDGKGLWKEFHDTLYQIVDNVTKKGKRYQVYWEESFSNGNNFDATNAVIHYWKSFDKMSAINKGLYVIQSTNWYLPRMKPTG